jgi:hypothetical protein
MKIELPIPRPIIPPTTPEDESYNAHLYAACAYRNLARANFHSATVAARFLEKARQELALAKETVTN